MFRRSPATPPVAAPDPAARELRERLHSLHDHCLTNLVAGLDAMTRGDLTVHVAPATKPITTRSENAETQELVDLFNSMLAKAQTALEGYNAVREEMRAALGDESCLEGLQARLKSMTDHCLTGLGQGLTAMADGDLTVDVQPATTPLSARPGKQLGDLGETFNVMLGMAQGGLEAYNATRTGVADISCEAPDTRPAVSPISVIRRATPSRVAL
jgi:methyl-accepting chemotaxis protein